MQWPIVFRIAASLSDHHSATVGTRSLDILHVAAAKLLRANEFVSFDRRQRILAASAGLKVVP
jgi:predicted nucleic acid-binding protein